MASRETRPGEANQQPGKGSNPGSGKGAAQGAPKGAEPGQEGEPEQNGASLLRFTPELMAVCGLVSSFVLFSSLRSAEHAAARASFELEADQGAAELTREFGLAAEQLRSVVALFASSNKVEKQEFRDFTARGLERNPALRLVGWSADPPADASVPCTLSYAEGPAATAGLTEPDLAQQPALRAVLERARASSDPVLSAPIPGLGVPQETWVAMLSRVHSSSGENAGLVLAMLDLERLLAATRIYANGLPWSLSDITTSSTLRLAGVPADGEPGRVKEHSFGGRGWRIETHMPPAYLAQRTTWRPWGALALGLIATGLLVTAIVFATSRARIRLLVERRSKEIEAAYDTLAHEAQQRLWAMAEMRQVQARMRQIIDLVPNWIYVKDRFGCFLLANEATAEAYGTTVARLTAPSRIDFNAAPQSDEILRAERALVEEQRSEITPVQPFRDAEGRMRLLRTIKIPCVFEDETKALLCVATDVTEQEQASRMLRSQNRILAELARGQDPDTVLEELVHEAEELVPGMRCSVLLRSADGRHLEHGFGPSLPDFYNAAVEGLEIGPGIGSCGAAAHSGERVVVEDVSTHPNWATFRELTRRASIGACWSQPIRSVEGEILGTFAMYYATARGPADLEIKIIESWAHLAGIAIERRRQVAG